MGSACPRAIFALGLGEYYGRVIRILKTSQSSLESRKVIGMLLGGLFVVEFIFSYPGFGLMTINAVFQRDFPVVQAVAVLSSGVLVSVNMLDTGFDCPDVRNLVMARFTHSTILYRQMRGRAQYEWEAPNQAAKASLTLATRPSASSTAIPLASHVSCIREMPNYFHSSEGYKNRLTLRWSSACEVSRLATHPGE